MTAVRLRDAVAYGARLYAFLLVATLVGGAMTALGGALLWSQSQHWLGSGSLETTTAVSGGILTFFGVTILVISFLGAGFKLLADGIAAGGTSSKTGASFDADATRPGKTHKAPEQLAGSGAAAEPDSDISTGDQVGPRETPSVDPEASETAANDGARAEGGRGVDQATPVGVDKGRDATADEATSVAGDDVAGASDAGSEPAEDPPEPSPEEIAFGTSKDDESTEDEWAGETQDSIDDTSEKRDDSDSDSVQPAGRNAQSDPLGDPFGNE